MGLCMFCLSHNVYQNTNQSWQCSACLRFDYLDLMFIHLCLEARPISEMIDKSIDIK